MARPFTLLDPTVARAFDLAGTTTTVGAPLLRFLQGRELRPHAASVFGATLAVARKLVAYLLAVDKSGQSFQVRPAWPADRVEQDQTQKIKTA